MACLRYLTLTEDGGEPPLVVRYDTWGDPAAATLILVHELGGTLESFRPFAELLADEFCVIAFDQRAAGLSEKPVRPLTLHALAQDVGRVADAAGVTQPFHLLGLAMGAVVAVQFAITQLSRLRRLVLCDGTPGLDDRMRAYVRDRAAAVRARGMYPVAEVSLKNSFRGLSEGEALPAYLAYRARFLSNPPEGYAMHSEALADMAISDEEFRGVSCPTLVLTGRNDFIWPPESGQALAAKLPRARFEVVEGAAHFPPVQQARVVADRVRQFLQRSP